MDIKNQSSEISILIDKAVIKSIKFDLPTEIGELPDLTMEIALLSVSGKKVTDVTLSTKKYYGVELDQVDLPSELYSYLGTLVNKLMPVAVRKINSIEKLLEAK